MTTITNIRHAGIGKTIADLKAAVAPS